MQKNMNAQKAKQRERKRREKTREKEEFKDRQRRVARETESIKQLPGIEKQFFLKAREALDSHQAWTEFLKVLELFSAEVIGERELIAVAADLFNKPGHAALLDELQFILERSQGDASGAGRGPEFELLKMPLSEQDYSASENCSPSYWKISEHYPKLVCSERSPADQAVLNDEWISVPIDVEFKNRTKNQYLDNLLKCEDERYEIDMIMECNQSAIRALEPLAEEIKVLMDKDSAAKWQYRLDKRSLSVIHLKAIARVYADHGKEILELLRKNPANAIPVILRRLKAKDSEWRQVVEGLNRTWRDTMQKNYLKSLDFQSFQFKRDDPKNLASKALMAQAAARAGHSTSSPGGTDGTVGGGSDANGVTVTDEVPNATLDAIIAFSNEAAAPADPASSSPNTASTTEGVARGGDTYTFEYPDRSVLADVFQLHMYAVEHTTSVSADNKTRAADAWARFFRRFFGLPAGFLESNVRPSNREIQKRLDEARNARIAPGAAGAAFASAGATLKGSLLGQDGRLVAPLAPGAACKTPAGSGVVQGFHKTRGIYEVKLSFATGFIHKSNIEREDTDLRSGAGAAVEGHQKAQTALETVPVAIDDRGLSEDEEDDEASSSRLPATGDSSYALPYLGNKNMFLYLRSHEVLYSRLIKAKSLCKAAAEAPKNTREGVPGTVDAGDAALSWEGNYKNVLAACFAQIDGTIEMGRFEDLLRLMLGADGYELFTLDRVLSLAMKQLNHLAQPHPRRLMELHLRTLASSGGAAPSDLVRTYASEFVAAMRAEKETDAFWFQFDGSHGEGGDAQVPCMHVRYLPSIKPLPEPSATPTTATDSASSEPSNAAATADNSTTQPVKRGKPEPRTEAADEALEAAAASQPASEQVENQPPSHKRMRVETAAEDSASAAGGSEGVADSGNSNASGESEQAPAPAPRLTRSMRSRH